MALQGVIVFVLLICHNMNLRRNLGDQGTRPTFQANALAIAQHFRK